MFISLRPHYPSAPEKHPLVETTPLCRQCPSANPSQPATFRSADLSNHQGEIVLYKGYKMYLTSRSSGIFPPPLGSQRDQ